MTLRRGDIGFVVSFAASCSLCLFASAPGTEWYMYAVAFEMMLLAAGLYFLGGRANRLGWGSRLKIAGYLSLGPALVLPEPGFKILGLLTFASWLVSSLLWWVAPQLAAGKPRVKGSCH